MGMRIGYGFDSHAFKAGVPLVIGGLAIEHPEGLAGHSDGDVLLHAITDALLGAVSAGDIGTFLSAERPAVEGCGVERVFEDGAGGSGDGGVQDRQCGFGAGDGEAEDCADCWGVARERGGAFGSAAGEVGIKAKTPEGLNQDNVAVAHVTVLLESLGIPESVGAMVAVADVDDEIDVVVKGLVGGTRGVSALGRKVTPFDTDDLT